MRAVYRAICDYLSRSIRDFIAGWSQFWFRPTDTTTLAAVRICTGLTLLALYGSLLPEMDNYLGADAWVDRTAMDQIRAATVAEATASDVTAEALVNAAAIEPWFAESLWYYVEQPSLISLFYWYFLAAIACFTVGLFSRTANVLVWIGHVSCAQRSLVTTYGVDVVLAMLLLYLLLGPTGRSLSVDRLLSDYWRRNDRTLRGKEDGRSWSATFAIRLIQVHMCVIYLCAGLSKLQGESWWDGSAMWLTLMMPEMSPLDMSWFASLGDGQIQLICAIGTILTLGYEISFSFLIWNHRLRPLVLTLAILLHGGIGLFMGLGLFSAAMLAGCLSFVDPLTLSWLLHQLIPSPLRTALPSVDRLVRVHP